MGFYRKTNIPKMTMINLTDHVAFEKSKVKIEDIRVEY